MPACSRMFKPSTTTLAQLLTARVAVAGSVVGDARVGTGVRDGLGEVAIDADDTDGVDVGLPTQAASSMVSITDPVAEAVRPPFKPSG